MSVRLPAFGFALLGTLGACGSDIGVDPDQPFSIGAGVGTMGAVIEPSLRTGPRSGVRVPIGLGSLSGSRTIDGIKYDVDTPLGGVGLIADYYLLPTGSGFPVACSNRALKLTAARPEWSRLVKTHMLVSI